MTTKSLNTADLAQFTGSEQWYRHRIVRDVLFTDGAKYVADAGGAYWLLDEIAFAQRGVNCLVLDLALKRSAITAKLALKQFSAYLFAAIALKLAHHGAYLSARARGFDKFKPVFFGPLIFLGVFLYNEEFIRNFICRVFADCLRKLAGAEQRI